MDSEYENKTANFTVISSTQSPISETTQSETVETYVNVSFSLAWLILFFSTLSVLTNLISACVYSRRCMRSPINVMLTGLSVIDLLLSLVWIPTFVVPCLYVYYRLPILKSIMGYSQVYIYPFTFIFHCASVYTLVVISIDRMISVLWPFQARWHSTRRALSSLLFVSVMSVLYNCVRFFEFRTIRNEQDPNAPIEVALVLRDTEQYPLYMALYCNLSYFIVHFLVPFTLLSVVNSLMIGSIYRAAAQRRMLSNQQQREHRTALMMAMTVLLFLVCNTLPLILNAIELVKPQFFYDQATMVLAFTLNDACNVLIVFNTSCTAFIYFCFCQKYRRVASQMFLQLYQCSITRVTLPPARCPQVPRSSIVSSKDRKISVAQSQEQRSVCCTPDAIRITTGYLELVSWSAGRLEHRTLI